MDVFVALTGVSWLAIVVMASLTVGPNTRYLFPVLLLLTPLGAAGLVATYRQLHVHWGKVAMLLPAVTGIVAVTYHCIELSQAFLMPELRADLELGRVVQGLTGPECLVATSARRGSIHRGASGWYADRKTVCLPRDGRHVQRLLDECVAADLVVLDSTPGKAWFEPAAPNLPAEEWLSGYRLVREVRLETTTGTYTHPVYLREGGGRER